MAEQERTCGGCRWCRLYPPLPESSDTESIGVCVAHPPASVPMPPHGDLRSCFPSVCTKTFCGEWAAREGEGEAKQEIRESLLYDPETGMNRVVAGCPPGAIPIVLTLGGKTAVTVAVDVKGPGVVALMRAFVDEQIARIHSRQRDGVCPSCGNEYEDTCPAVCTFVPLMQAKDRGEL